jgi:hypothetical protein
LQSCLRLPTSPVIPSECGLVCYTQLLERLGSGVIWKVPSLESLLTLPAAMTRKKIAMITLIGFAAVTLSSVLAYRLGFRHAAAGDERESRQDAVPSGCIEISKAGFHTGENTCVEGRVLHVYTSRSGSTFLDFCADYHHCPFGSVVFASDRSKFGNLGVLEGKRVDLSGEISTYNGRAEIIIREPRQIRLAE